MNSAECQYDELIRQEEIKSIYAEIKLNKINEIKSNINLENTFKLASKNNAKSNDINL